MLQISSDDTCHTQVLCLSLDSREDTTDSAHDQINLYTSPGSFCHLTDKVHICHGIHLHNDSSVLAFPDLFIHQSQYRLLQACR